MKNGFILLAIIIIMAGVCGCTQTAPPVQPTAAATMSPPTTELPMVSATPTLLKTPSVSDNTITIKNFAFDPASITVKVGSTVRWVNQDSVPHRIVFADKSISSVLLAASQSASQKFDQPGIYNYICSIHTDMHGTVIVK